jgi:hypothetical protein
MSTVCPDCGDEFESLGKHLRWSCSVRVDDVETIDALLIGDGTLDNGNSGNYRLTVDTTTKEYVSVIEEMLGWLHNTTKKYDPQQDGWKEKYQVRTHCLESITEQYDRWYPNGEKRIPDDMKITPKIMKHWYCADGNLKENSAGNYRISIGSKSWMDEAKRIESLFPFSASYAGYEICFPVSETEEIVEYMGEPPAGFEYKWPDRIDN